VHTPVKIRLFIKDPCGWCDRAEAWLSQRGIVYETINVSASREAFDEMIRLSGQTFAPVIEVDGKILADFGPEELAVFWEKISPNQKS
jgi:glutaredoxin 3